MSENAAIYEISCLCTFNFVPIELVPQLLTAVVGKQYTEELNEFLGEDGSWRRTAYEKIGKVDKGYLATYGRIAAMVEEETGRNPGARSVAWLRKRLYIIMTHDTCFPLHRIAKVGDVDSLADSDETKAYNDPKRKREGSLTNPRWL